MVRVGHLQLPRLWNRWRLLKGLTKNYTLTQSNSLLIVIHKTTSVKVVGCMRLLSTHNQQESFLNLSTKDPIKQEQANVKIDTYNIISRISARVKRKISQMNS